MTERFVSQVTHLEPRHKLKALSLALTLLSVAVAVPAYALEEMTDAGMSDATGEGLAIFATNFAFQMPSVAGDYSKGNMNYISPTTGQNLFGAGAYSGTTSSSSSTFINSLSPAFTTPGSPATNTISNGDNAAAWNGNTRCTYQFFGTNTCDIKFTNYVNSGTQMAINSSNAIIGAAGGYGSYIYLAPIGSVPLNTNRADIYIYGLSISANDNSTKNTDGSVVVPATGLQAGGATTHNTLFNQAGTGVDWGSVGDPFTLSVQSSAAVGLDGTAVATPVPYLSIAAPTGSSGNNMRLGAWFNVMQYDSTSGALNNKTEQSLGTAGPALQIQMVWDGFGINGTQINLFPTPQSTTACTAGASGNCQLANTLGFNGVLRINSQPTGVLRLSVAEGSITYGASSALPTTASYQNYNAGGFFGASTVDRNVQTITDTGVTATDNPVGQFDPYEGVYIQNLHANLVLGAFNFQPLVLSSTNGMISLELGRIPNNSAAYSKYYIDYGQNGDGTGASTGLVASALGNCTATACPSTATHSSITIGDVYLNSTASPVTKTYYLSENDGTDGTNNQSKLAPTATCTANGASPNCFAVTETIYPGQSNALYKADGTLTSTSVNGITFKAPGAQGATVNLGTASISGMMINHMKMTLTGL